MKIGKFENNFENTSSRISLYLGKQRAFFSYYFYKPVVSVQSIMRVLYALDTVILISQYISPSVTQKDKDHVYFGF